MSNSSDSEINVEQLTDLGFDEPLNTGEKEQNLKRKRDENSSDSEFEELPMAPRAPHQGPINESSAFEEEDTVAEDRQIPASPPNSTTDKQQDIRSFIGCGSFNDYLLEKKIGEGTFGEVSLAKHLKTKKRVALKRILIHNEREGMPMTALREIRILKRLKHPNIIRLMEMAIKKTIRDKKESRHSYMVFPYIEHDLDGLLQNPNVRFTPSQTKSYIQQILKGVDHLHKNWILHRDIKSSNILINNTGLVKLADFGLARPFSETTSHYTNMVVTRWYRPPELLMGAVKYDGKIDIWGVGCVFGEILKRRAILPGNSDMDQLTQIWELCGTPTERNWPGKGYLNYPMFVEGGAEDFDEDSTKKKTLYQRFPMKHYRKETVDLLQDLLSICPDLRPTAAEALESEYFSRSPSPAVPGTNDFQSQEDSHEIDSRKAKINRLGDGTRIHLPNHHDAIGHGKSFARSIVG